MIVDFADTPYPESYPNIELDAKLSKDVNSQVETPEKKDSKQSQFQSTLRNTEDSPESSSKFELGIDWDSEQNWQRIFWARIIAEKKQRQQEFEILRRERFILEREKRQLTRIFHLIRCPKD